MPLSSPSSRRVSSSTRVDRVRDRLVSPEGLVLVDHRGPRRVVPHAAMRSCSPAPLLAANWLPVCRRSWKCKPRHAERLDHVRPAGELTEVVPPKRNAFDAGEDERKIILPSKKGSLHRNRGGSHPRYQRGGPHRGLRPGRRAIRRRVIVRGESDKCQALKAPRGRLPCSAGRPPAGAGPCARQAGPELAKMTCM
jgi:hypothetical protein